VTGVAPTETHYQVLGLEPRATAEQIEKAYKFHLGLYGEEALATYSLLDAEELRLARARVHEAFEVLRDPSRRYEYDVANGFVSGGSLVIRFPMGAPAERPAGPPTDKPMGAPAESPADNPVAASQAEPPQPDADPPPASIPGVTAASTGLPPAASAPPAAAPVRTPPRVLPDPVDGAALRRFREERGISLREISLVSKVGVRYFEYIEADRHALLPASVYLRGFLQEYARVVGLEPRRTAESYLAGVPRDS
jgi:curved DNA-binding protein CbpA